MTKVAIIGSGFGLSRAIVEALSREQVVINADNGVVNPFGTLPQGYPTPERKHPRNTGAARIKRNAKQRRRRKG